MAEKSPDAMQRWLNNLSQVAENPEILDTLVSLHNDRIVAANPEVAEASIRRDLDASTRFHWKGYLSVVNLEAFDVQVGTPVYDFARTLARRGVELPVLLSVYRLGQRGAWDYITELLRTDVADTEVRSALLLHLWSRITQWLDTSIEHLIPVFIAEREQWQRGEDARRADVVNALIAGKSVDSEAAAATIQYPLNHHHTAFILQVTGDLPGYETPRVLDAAVKMICKWIGGGTPVVVSSGAHSAWLWVAQLSPRLVGGPTPELPPGVRATVGMCHPEPSGFRLSHLEARAALAVADRYGNPVVHYADVELACLAGGVVVEDVRAEFVSRELGGLSADDDATQRIRETLLVYLQQGCDASATAERLHLHPNGVRYRVKQAEEKLGHGVNQGRAHLELALEMRRVLG